MASSACCERAEKLIAEKWPRLPKSWLAREDYLSAINLSANPEYLPRWSRLRLQRRQGSFSRPVASINSLISSGHRGRFTFRHPNRSPCLRWIPHPLLASISSVRYDCCRLGGRRSPAGDGPRPGRADEQTVERERRVASVLKSTVLARRRVNRTVRAIRQRWAG